MKKVNEQTIKKIISEYDAEIPNGVIALKYRISPATVNRILKGEYDERFRSTHYPRTRGWQTGVLYRTLAGPITKQEN